MFGDGYAAAHPELVASSDYAAQLVARAIEHVAEALLVEEEIGSGRGSTIQSRQLITATD